ncbi:glycosyltransferase family 2 protein [Tautonia rosea]|uniref:glycosyltransferase family 2 protein n=1 Tax=Tautonia rosea TaxID=2728037 RepID=UPI0019D078B0|nr:glycosyltransferase family 2 protein [Tautonia rosea]
MRRIAIVILNYRTPLMLRDCLASLEDEVDPLQDRVVVVDNASGDDSVQQIQQAIDEHCWHDWVTLIASEVNGGFSAGNNLGIQAVHAQAYLLLNSDTIVRPGAIASLLAALDAHPEVGLIGPRLEWPDGRPQISCFRFPSPASELISAARTGPVTSLLRAFEVPIPVSDEPFEPQWISFACVLVRRAVIDQIGPMDEGYFMYFEDIDYCRRARQAGWGILSWPDAHVVHLRGGSSPVKEEMAARKRPRPYLYASRSRYFARFYGGVPGLFLANLLWYAGRLVSLSREYVGNKKPHTCEAEAIDLWTNWRSPLQQQPQRLSPSASQQPRRRSDSDPNTLSASESLADPGPLHHS